MVQYLTTNPNYIVTLAGGITGGRITGNATSKLSIQVNNKWVNILEALGLSESGSGVGASLATVANGFMLATGSNYLPVIATSLVWRASSGIELSLDFRFDAVQNAEVDVLEPVKKLIAMWMPTRTGAFFHPPGPTPAEAFGSGLTSILNSIVAASPFNISGGFSAPSAGYGNTITAYLGQTMAITDLVPVDIKWEFENRFDAVGNPMAALVNVTLQSFVVPSVDDVLGYFVNQAATPSPTNQLPPSGVSPVG